MSGLDKSFDNAFYEITIDPKTELPLRIQYVVLVAPSGVLAEERPVIENQRIVGGRHYVFHFDFSFSKFGELKTPKIPKAVASLLKKVRADKKLRP